MGTSKHDWRPVGAVAPESLTDARLQCHYAAQWLARVARAFVPPEDDDSHTSLMFDASTGMLATQPFVKNLRLGLDIGELRLAEMRDGGVTRALDLDGCSDAKAGDWVARLVAGEGLEVEKLQAPSPWDMPMHGLASGTQYRRGPGMSEFAGWYHNAHAILSDVRDRYANLSPGPYPVRCWPHHFDMAVLVALESGDPE